MTELHTTFDQKIENIQNQLDVMRHEDAVFKGFVHRQFDTIATEMVTKDDLYRMEARMDAKFATKDDFERFATKQDFDGLQTKQDLQNLTALVMKIAEKVGVLA